MARFTLNGKNIAGNSKTANISWDLRGYSAENYFVNDKSPVRRWKD
jgi:hypothetical protein